MVVTHSKIGEERVPSLLRSYEHPKPALARASAYRSTKAPTESDSQIDLHHPPLDACTTPLWQIAQEVFRPPNKRMIKAKQSNPTATAWAEVKQMHPRFDPHIVISMGVKPTQDWQEAARNEKKPFLQFWDGRRSLSQRRDQHRTHAERSHKDFRHLVELLNAGRQKSDTVHYFRFNPPCERSDDDMVVFTNVEEVQIIKGEVSDDIARLLQERVNAYVRDHNNELTDCARKLVEIRHRRQQTVRWESFALGIRYRCPEGGECEHYYVHTRVDLRRHAEEHHGFFVPRRIEDGLFCTWGICEEGTVPVFRSRTEYLDHMRHAHGFKGPKILTMPELERWLDRGRVADN